MLEQHGIKLTIASMGSVKPLDHRFLQQCVSEGYSHWISLEEHHRNGGLGSALLEWLSEEEIDTVKLQRIGIEDHFLHQIGDQSYVREIEGINATAITKLVKSL